LFDFDGYELKKVICEIFFFIGYIRVYNRSMMIFIDF